MLKSPGIAVERINGEKFLKYAVENHILDRRKRIFSDSSYIYFPILENSIVQGLKVNEYDFQLRENMALKEYLQEKYGERVESLKWQRVGESLIFSDISLIDREMAEDIVNKGFATSVLKRTGSVSGSERRPSLNVLSGKPSDTVHRENGINFILNPEKIMISKGNISERGIPFLKLLRGRKILDMFSGIGYFSLPMAAKMNSDELTCTDINSTAIEYLLKSYRASEISTKLEALNMDCRLIPPERKYDIILMGNFKSINYLPAALSHIENIGQIILHYLSPTGTHSSHMELIMKSCRSMSFLFNLLETHRVKSYAPHLWHMSSLIEVTKSD